MRVLKNNKKRLLLKGVVFLDQVKQFRECNSASSHRNTMPFDYAEIAHFEAIHSAPDQNSWTWHLNK